MSGPPTRGVAPEDVEKERERANREKREAKVESYYQQIVGTLQSVIEQAAANHKQNERAEVRRRRVDRMVFRRERRRFWIEVSGVIAVFSATIAAFVAIYVASHDASKERGVLTDQQHVMQGQLDEIKAEQRAWVYGDIVPESDAVYENGNMEMSFKVTLRNVGHQPAKFVFPLIYGTERERISAQGRDERAFQFGICDPEKGKHVSERIATRGGRSVFPGQTAEITIPVTFADPGARYPASWGEDTFLPIVLGCIAYQFVGDGSWHQTGFIFRLERDGPFDPMVGKRFHVKEGDIKRDRLHLVALVDGRGFYAY